MLVQISSGQGPIECSIAVQKLCYSFLDEYPGSSIVLYNMDYSGNGFKSATMDIPSGDIQTGSVLWICKSPVRPNHKRKNWFVDVSIIPDDIECPEFNESDYEITTMHSSGNGGQNVNKVETGVRIKHIPTGITVSCTEERSQYLNKQKAFKKMKVIFATEYTKSISSNKNTAWKKHTEITRGNPFRVYSGEDFKRTK